MRFLILGGSGYLGRHVVAELLAAGHQVANLARGKMPDQLPGSVERLYGDRDRGLPDLAALDGRTWDVCIDISGYTPRQVRPSAESLRERVGRYVFVSAVAVYGDRATGPVRETDERITPVAEDVTEVVHETYGGLKVACENLLSKIYSERCTLLRPQVVIGPDDPSGRYSYWVQRAAQGGQVLAPGDGSDYLQVIDVRDLARFVLRVAEHDLAGVFNLSGPRITWATFIKLLGVANPVWVPAEIIRAAGVDGFQLPLFRPMGSGRAGLMDVSHEKALAAGLTLTDPAVTVRDTRASFRGKPFVPSLSPDRESELIRRASGGP